jgi:hypothetical protein
MCYLNADFVADDRLLLRPGHRGLIGHPWPDTVQLPRRILSILPELRRLDPELAITDRPSRDTGGALEVNPSALCAIFQRRAADLVRPELLLFPTLMLGITTVPSPKWLRPAMTGPLLRASGLFSNAASAQPRESWRFPGFPETPETAPEARTRILALLTPHIPAAQITVAHSPQLLATHIAELLAQLRTNGPAARR